jgi:hypothetical protein
MFLTISKGCFFGEAAVFNALETDLLRLLATSFLLTIPLKNTELGFINFMVELLGKTLNKLYK